MPCYRIREWTERYEVDDRGRPAPGARPGRAGPLPFVRLPAFGHVQGAGYRRLARLCGTAARLEACMCVWPKLMELAAHQPRGRRGWILNEKDEPATAEDIAFLTGFRRSTVETALKYLSAQEVRWIEQADFVSDSPQTSTDLHKPPPSSRKARNETETETETDTETEETPSALLPGTTLGEGTEAATAPPPKTPTPEKRVPLDSVSVSNDEANGGNGGNARLVRCQIMALLGITRRTVGPKQFAADVTDFNQIAEDVLDGAIGPPGEALTEIKAAIREAKDKGNRPVAWFRSWWKRRVAGQPGGP
ncbi:MAG: hypothetical protein PHU85_00655 [Phycisphaerae bacterium]|nr:hypothetical protein [Phycisphaerae bacterium]